MVQKIPDFLFNVLSLNLSNDATNYTLGYCIKLYINPVFRDILVSYSALFTFWSGGTAVLLAFPWVMSFLHVILPPE
jgi:hypothetical protein